MDERRLKKRMRYGITICSIIAAIILSAGIIIVANLNISLSDVVYDQVATETNEMVQRVHRQIKRDFQSLYTIAELLNATELEKTDDFAEALRRANLKNDFVTMSYFGKDGKGTIAHYENGLLSDLDYRTDLPEASSKAIAKAFEGEATVSRMFESLVAKQRIFVYAIPLFDDNGEVKAVLAASDFIDIFDTAFNEEPVLGGNGAVQLVSADSTVLVSSGIIDENITLNQMNYFSNDDRENLRRVIRGETENTFLNITVEDTKYLCYLTPVGVNDWYLLCLHDRDAANTTVRSIFTTITITFVLLLAVIMVLLILIVRAIHRTNVQLTHMAYYDRLTGSDNMLRFNRNIDEARPRDKQFCVVAINVKQFKFINEIYGTEVADHLLITIADSIRNMIKPGEFFARDSADLFYIYLAQHGEAAVYTRIESLIRSIANQEHNESRDYQLQMYSGAYIHDDENEPGLSKELLITRALFAMKYCKDMPSRLLHFYDDSIHKSEETENYIESHMQQALDTGEFKVFLQPKMDLRDNTLGGAEALVRWITKDNGMIFPNDFIPLFERNGFCIKLDMYMVENAFKIIRQWMDEGIKPIPISVNQSKLLFFEANYLPFLQRLIDQYKVPAQYITLEIIEGLALDHADEVNYKLRCLHEMGFYISMDDFGSGFSSFNTLGNLDINELKLDRSFLLEAASGESHRFSLIMSSIISLSKQLGITTVTEGVETKDDESFIRGLGCDFGQGYLYSKPISLVDFNKTYMEARRKAKPAQESE